MASITAGETRSTTPRGKAEPSAEVAVPSRREFLYYIWGASMALLLGETTAWILWFSLPRFKEGTFGGVFSYPPDKVPTASSPPVNVPEGRYWVSNIESQGLVILFGVCTHLGCLPKWVDNNNRFECPCHGSKYQKNGVYIEGPAPRSLDRFPTTIVFTDGTEAEMNENGDPIPLGGKEIANIRIDTGQRIKRAGRV